MAAPGTKTIRSPRNTHIPAESSGAGREELASAPPSFLIKIVGATNERGKIRRPPPPTAMINIIISGCCQLGPCCCPCCSRCHCNARCAVLHLHAIAMPSEEKESTATAHGAERGHAMPSPSPSPIALRFFNPALMIRSPLPAPFCRATHVRSSNRCPQGSKPIQTPGPRPPSLLRHSSAELSSPTPTPCRDLPRSRTHGH